MDDRVIAGGDVRIIGVTVLESLLLLCADTVVRFVIVTGRTVDGPIKSNMKRSASNHQRKLMPKQPRREEDQTV